MTRVTSRMIEAGQHFLKRGLVVKGASAIVGNLAGESGENLDSTMFRANPDFSGGVPMAERSGGIAEWLGDRKANYIKFSKEAEHASGAPDGNLLNDLITQCDFLLQELTAPRYAGLNSQLRTEGRSIENLTANFMMIFERPSKSAAATSLDGRIAHAKATEAALNRILAAEAETAPIPAEPVPPPSSQPSQLPIPHIPLPPAGGPLQGDWKGAIFSGLQALRARYIAQQEKLDQEIATIDGIAAVINKLSPPEKGNSSMPAQMPFPAGMPTTQMPIPAGKAAINSTGMIGGLIAFLSPFLPSILNLVGNIVPPEYKPLVSEAAALIGGIMAMYGRGTAKQPITGLFTAK